MASTTTAAGAASALAPVASPAPALLKTDARGRVRATPERRAAILAEFERSGVSAAQFARLAGINYSTFAQWVQKHRRRQASPRRVVPRPSARGLQLVEAVVASTAGGAPLVVQLPGGVRAELAAERQVPLVVALARALEGRC
jgi:transposase-like protein